MESWFSTVKSEEGERFESTLTRRRRCSINIEAFYNQRRRHSTLGQISPAVFERRNLDDGGALGGSHFRTPMTTGTPPNARGLSAITEGESRPHFEHQLT